MMGRIIILTIIFNISVFTAACADHDRAISFIETAKESDAEDESGALSYSKEANNFSDEKEDEASETICVYVCGAVKNPGVYYLGSGSRINDALVLAGGFTEDADENYVNLAEPLRDAQRIYFPDESEIGLLDSVEDTKDSLININTADEALLCTLPGIGSARAGDIINYREQNGDFESCEDIMNVPGIKTAAYEKIKEMITVN